MKESIPEHGPLSAQERVEEEESRHRVIVVEDAKVSPHGEERAEGEDEEESKPEDRDGYSREGHRHRSEVDPGALVNRREDSQKHSDDRGQDHGGDGQFDGGGEPPLDLIGDLYARLLVGFAEIALKQFPQVDPVLE